MMNNLFSMFDPSTFYWSSSWLILMAVLFMKPMKIHKNNSNMKNNMTSIYKKIEKELSQLMGKSNKKMSSPKLMKIFMIMMISNTLALVPFNFTPTAHMSITLMLSLTLWATSMINGWINSPKNMMIHMTPMGTPNTLMNFMVIIEAVSNLIRPITLSVRLSANMVAGHLLISLLSNFSMISYSNTLSSSSVMMILSLLEIMVALIQAYVIITLTTLYQNESF